MNFNATKIHNFIGDLPPHLAERSRLKSSGPADHVGKYVLYWTHHALRTDENPALDFAMHLADQHKLPLVVYQGLSEQYRFSSDRHHTFILEAARDLEASYAKLGITYVTRRSQWSPPATIGSACQTGSCLSNRRFSDRSDKNMDRSACTSKLVSNRACGYRLCGSHTLDRKSIRSRLCISRCNSNTFPRTCQPTVAPVYRETHARTLPH